MGPMTLQDALTVIDSHRTPAGGFTQATLAGWGVAWPPVKGWKRDLAHQMVAGQVHVPPA